MLYPGWHDGYGGGGAGGGGGKRGGTKMDAHKMLTVIVSRHVTICQNFLEPNSTPRPFGQPGLASTWALHSVNEQPQTTRSQTVPKHLYRSTCFEGFRRIRWQLEWLDNETFKLEHGTHPRVHRHGHVMIYDILMHSWSPEVGGEVHYRWQNAGSLASNEPAMLYIRFFLLLLVCWQFWNTARVLYAHVGHRRTVIFQRFGIGRPFSNWCLCIVRALVLRMLWGMVFLDGQTAADGLSSRALQIAIVWQYDMARWRT